jgi:hypothetical protein
MATTTKKKNKGERIEELASMLDDIKAEIDELRGADGEDPEENAEAYEPGEALDLDQIDFGDDPEGEELRADGSAADLFAKVFENASRGGDFKPVKGEQEEDEEEPEGNGSDPLRRPTRRAGTEVRAKRGTTRGAAVQKKGR